MKLETFFEKFDQFADAPGAVAKMRELVLQLAVTGKLVPQDDLNESAELLLERAAEEALKLPIATKYQRLTKDAEEHLASRELQSLPCGWVWTCSAVIGETAPRVDADDDALVAFAPMHLLPTDYRSTFTPEVRPWREIKKGYTHFADGDVGFAKITPCFQNGKGCVFANLPGGIGSGTTELHILRPFSNVVLPLYALLFYKSPEFVAGGVASFSGTAGQQRVSNDYFRFAPFPLPPLAEQERIVAKVDELMALCDRLETQQQAREEQSSQLARASLARFATAPTPANLNYLFHPSYNISPADLRKSILTLAVQGKLVPQDPNDEPAEELFQRIKAERAEEVAKGTYKSRRPLEPIDEIEEPFKVPVEWKWARLGSLVFTLGDGLHGTPEYSEGTDCYFINGNNLLDGRIVIKPHTKTVSVEEAMKHRKPMTLNTVLVSINGTLGSVAFYKNENVILGKSACYFNLASLVDKQFARRVIESPYFVNYASENATGTTIRNLGLRAMNDFPFPLPPLNEQHRIVAKVEHLMSLVDELETHLTTTRTTAQNLLSALVAELTKRN